MITEQEKHILKAISETVPISYSECVKGYLNTASFDTVLKVIDESCKTGVSIERLLNATGRFSINTNLSEFALKRNILQHIVDWFKSIFKKK